MGLGTKGICQESDLGYISRVYSKRKTLREGETSVFPWEPEKLRDETETSNCFIRARDVQTLRRSDVIHRHKQTNQRLETFLALNKIETSRRLGEKIETVRLI